MSASKQAYNRKRRKERSWDPDKVLAAMTELAKLGHPEERHTQILHDMTSNGTLDLGAPNPWKKRKKVKKVPIGVTTRVRGMGKCTKRARPSCLQRDRK